MAQQSTAATIASSKSMMTSSEKTDVKLESVDAVVSQLLSLRLATNDTFDCIQRLSANGLMGLDNVQRISEKQLDELNKKKNLLETLLQNADNDGTSSAPQFGVNDEPSAAEAIASNEGLSTSLPGADNGTDEIEMAVDKRSLQFDYLATLRAVTGSLAVIIDGLNKTKRDILEVNKVGEDLRKRLIEIIELQKSLDRTVAQLAEGCKSDREVIADLENKLNRQKNLVDKLRLLVDEMKASSAAESQRLSEEIENLSKQLHQQREQQMLHKKNAELRKNAEFDEEPAVFVLMRLLAEVTSLMYKRIFTSDYKPKRTYTFSQIIEKLKKLEKSAKSDDERREFEKKNRAFEQLKGKLEWAEGMEQMIETIKTGCGARGGGHANLESVENIEKNISLLEQSGNLLEKDELEFCRQLAKMWGVLSEKS